MKILWLLSFVFAAIGDWEQQDIEIFQLNDDLVGIQQDATFYSILDISMDASEQQVRKACNKKSLELHPDKNPTQEAAVLHKLLTSICTILKDVDYRKKYNMHLEKGFPIWKGTGYYYTKYKPGIFTAIFFIFLFISITEYIVAWIHYFKEIGKLEQEKEKLNNVTYTQLKKQLKKQQKEGSPVISKKQFKQSNAADLLPLRVVEKPKIADLMLLKFPISLLYPLISSKKESTDCKKDQ